MRADELVKSVREKLLRAGNNDYMEAEWIVALGLNTKPSRLFSIQNVTNEQKQKVTKMLERRIKGEPLEYIVGTAEFYKREFDVCKSVLIPRPETELLVEEIIGLSKEYKVESILDIGTGSGAIAITLALETNASVSAVDISLDALKVASSNALKLGADVEFIKSNLFEHVKGKFDLIVSNPPYIKSGDIEGLEENVKGFEPRLALDGGESGLDFYMAIIEKAKAFLNINGILAFEIGIGQTQDIIDKFTHCGFEILKVKKDYNKIDRIIIAKLVGK